MGDWTDITSVLAWLTGVGAPWVTGYILSLLAENWPGWHDLPRTVKFAAPMITSVLISIGATLLARNTEFVGQIGPTWALVAGAAIAYLGSQQAYMAAKRSGYGESAKLA